MSFYRLFCFFFIFFWVFQCQAQVQFSGKVIDKDSKEPLPFVNVQAYPSLEGVSTDFEGNFKFKSSKNIAELKFSFIGYETFTYKIQNNIDTSIVIELISTGIEISEATVQAKKNKKKIPKDTLAVSLQQLVVDNKEFNRPKSFESYSFKEHTKIEFDFYKLEEEKFLNRWIFKPFRVINDYIDTTENGVSYLPLLLQEKISQHYYQSNPKLEKNIVLGQYLTGVQSMSAMVILDDIFENFDLYDNLIIAGGKSFTSPFSNSGLVTYRYYITDSLLENNSKFYRLDFTPKSKESIAFNGYAWIDSKTYAIKEIEFTMPKQANINFVGEFKVKQEFEQVDSGRWMLSAEKIQIALNPTGKKNGKSLMVRKAMERGDVLVNQAINPLIFEGETNIISDSLKGGGDKDWWKYNRVSPLNDTEAGILTMSDSIENTKAFRNYTWLGGFASTAFLKFGPVEFGRFYQFVSWNSIEGIRPKMGIRTNSNFNKNLQLWAYVAYGTRDKEFKYFANARIMLPRVNNHWHVLEFNYKKDFTFLGQDYEDQQFSHDNMFLAILRKSPLEKIMLMENIKVMYERQWVNGYTTKFTAGVNTFYAVKDVFDFKHLNSNGSIEFYDKFHTTELGLEQHIAFGQNFFENTYYRFEGISKKPILDISYKLGLKDIANSDFSYHKLELILRQRLSSKLGFTYYQISGGKIFGNIPYPLMFIPIGNQNIYFNGKAYQLMNEFEYASDEYAAFWLEHHFDGLISNKIPLVNKLRLRGLVSAKAMIGNAKQSNLDFIQLPEGMRVPENWYIEAGFGIENILQLVRVDFYWRVTQRDVPDVQRFGIKIAVSPKL